MKFGKIKKLITCIALSATVACTVAMASGCNAETDHPEVSISYEFNGKTYVLEYTLYRNMYPNTVRHFIELTEEGFYNNTVIHDMESSDWFGGSYSYDNTTYASLVSSSDSMKEYFETTAKEATYYDLFNAGKLATTVYKNIKYDGTTQKIDKEYAMATLIGEFSDNQHKIDKGALTAEYGCLKMYYSEKETKIKVYVTPTSGEIAHSDYSKNCATYVFGMQVGSTSTYVASKYCVFATINDTTALEEFVNAVTDYNSEQYGTSDYYVTPEVDVDTLDNYSDKDSDRYINETFRTPKTPIIIKSVKVKKY